jgi:hypothetical protein
VCQIGDSTAHERRRASPDPEDRCFETNIASGWPQAKTFRKAIAAKKKNRSAV